MMEMTAIWGSYGWLMIPVGLFLGLLGYRLYKISLFLIGLFFGLALGSWIGENLSNPQLGLILGVVLGVALGVTTHFLIRFSLFLAGMAGGVVVASLVFPYVNVLPGSIEALLWSLGAAVAGGLLTLALYKFLILFTTSLIGTYLIYEGTVGFFPAQTQSWSWVLYVVLLAVFVVVQLGARKGHPDPVEQEKQRRKR
jgi:hypothetical protein